MHGSLKISKQQSAISIQPNQNPEASTLCRPPPRAAVPHKPSQACDPLPNVGIGFGFGWPKGGPSVALRWPMGGPKGRFQESTLFSTKRLRGVGSWLRDTGRGSQKNVKIAEIAKIGNIEGGLPRQQQILRFAQDFARGLTLRSRPRIGSTSYFLSVRARDSGASTSMWTLLSR